MRRVLIVLCAEVVLAGCGKPTAADLVAEGDRALAEQTASGARRAIELYDRALPLAGDPRAQARIHMQIGRATDFGARDRAAAEFAQAAALAAQAGDTETALLARIWAVGTKDESNDAQIAPLRALAAEAHAAHAPRVEALATARLARRLTLVRKPSEALQIVPPALALLKDAPEVATEAYLEHAFGVAYHSLGDAERAAPHMLRALELARAANDRLEEAHALIVYGHINYWLRLDPASALVLWTAALGVLRQAGLGEVSDTYDVRAFRANATASLGGGADARRQLLALAADARAADPARVGATRDQLLASILDVLAGTDEKLGENAEALATYREVAEIAQRRGDAHGHIVALIGAARASVALKRWRDVEELVATGVQHIEAREAEVTEERLRLSFAGAMRNVQKILVEARSLQADWPRAFEASERMRSRRLLAALGTAEILDGTAAQGLLDADTTLIEYAFGQTRAFAYVVDDRSIQGFDLGPVKPVSISARTWYDLASSAAAAPDQVAAATRDLADRIVAPLAPALHGKRLVVVPDQLLAYVAFAALPLPDGRPLVDRFELVHLPSASVLRALRTRTGARPRATRELAILADPIFDRGDARMGDKPPPATMAVARTADAATALARLPSTHDEALALAGLLPPAKVFLAEGKAATRAAALGPEVASARRIHFATHALLDNEDPTQSGLVFTQVDESGAPIDGFVRVADIEKARFAADLVVLSACRTALGKRFDGEGLVGLTRAFLLAGVPRVVSSLWQVDDAATAQLMRRFYQGLLADGLSAPAALRQAQREAKGMPPRLWAGFAFHGDWR